jgi:hypothetical protein
MHSDISYIFTDKISRRQIPFNSNKKEKQSRDRPGVTQRVPGLGSQISMTFGT